MLFQIVDELQVDVSVFIVIESKRRDQGIKIFHKIAEDRDLILLLN